MLSAESEVGDDGGGVRVPVLNLLEGAAGALHVQDGNPMTAEGEAEAERSPAPAPMAMAWHTPSLLDELDPPTSRAPVLLSEGRPGTEATTGSSAEAPNGRRKSPRSPELRPSSSVRVAPVLSE